MIGSLWSGICEEIVDPELLVARLHQHQVSGPQFGFNPMANTASPLPGTLRLEGVVLITDRQACRPVCDSHLPWGTVLANEPKVADPPKAARPKPAFPKSA